MTIENIHFYLIVCSIKKAYSNYNIARNDTKLN